MDSDLDDYFYEDNSKYSDELDSEAEVFFYNNEYYNVLSNATESNKFFSNDHNSTFPSNTDHTKKDPNRIPEIEVLDSADSDSIKVLSSEDSHDIYIINDEVYSEGEGPPKNNSPNKHKRVANEDSSSDEPKPSKKFKLHSSLIKDEAKKENICESTYKNNSPNKLKRIADENSSGDETKPSKKFKTNSSKIQIKKIPSPMPDSSNLSNHIKSKILQKSNFEDCVTKQRSSSPPNASLHFNSKSHYYIESSDSEGTSKDTLQKLINKDSIKLNTSSTCPTDNDASNKEKSSTKSEDNMLKEILESMPGEDHHWKLSSEDRNATPKTRDRRFCIRCKERGHISYRCPNPIRGPVCIYCGEEGHEKKYCPYPLCFNCFAPGHWTRHCLWSNEGIKCSHCSMKGHFKNECPDIWRRFYLTVSPGPIVSGPSIQVPKKAHCYNCGKSGHHGHMCPGKRFLSHTFASFPFIVSYDDPKDAQMYLNSEKQFKKKKQAIQKSNALYRKHDPFADVDSDTSPSQQNFSSHKKRKKKTPERGRRNFLNNFASAGQKFAKGVKQMGKGLKKTYEVEKVTKNISKKEEELHLSQRPQFMAAPSLESQNTGFPRNNSTVLSKKNNSRLKMLKNKCKQRLKKSSNSF